MNTCKCGCGTTLRKDNKSGYQKGHRTCPVCGSFTKGQNECCSKVCSAKLHWKRHPELNDARVWNETRQQTREQNKDKWIKNLSNSCKGRTPWNKGKKGLQTAWNKGLPPEEQPFYNKKHDRDFYEKQKQTNLERYGQENCGSMAIKTSVSNIELEYGDVFLEGYENNKRIGKYKVDYVNENTKHIVEIYGDYWHCHPDMFDKNDYHKHLSMTAKEKWIFDNKRKLYLENKGYKVDIVWERDAKQAIRNIQS